MNENNPFFTDEDWEDLLPSHTIQIASKTIDLKPFGLSDIVTVFRKLQTLSPEFKKAGITIQNFNTPEKLPIFVPLVIQNIPEIISVGTGIPTAEIKRLPLSPAIKLVVGLIEVNLKSQKGLEKNLRSLVELLTQPIEQQVERVQNKE